jgi:hypothetical protein
VGHCTHTSHTRTAVAHQRMRAEVVRTIMAVDEMMSTGMAVGDRMVVGMNDMGNVVVGDTVGMHLAEIMHEVEASDCSSSDDAPENSRQPRSELVE